jgi:hypothetical protein
MTRALAPEEFRGPVTNSPRQATSKAEDFKALSPTNLEGFLFRYAGVIKPMLAQKSGGRVVSITAALVDNPIIKGDKMKK